MSADSPSRFSSLKYSQKASRSKKRIKSSKSSSREHYQLAKLQESAIKHKLNEHQRKCKEGKSLSWFVKSQNELIDTSIYIQEPKTRTDEKHFANSSRKMQTACEELRQIKANLSRIVRGEEELLNELLPNTPAEFLLVKDVNLNIKINLSNGLKSPLRVIMTYPNDEPFRTVQVFTSHTAKQPSEEQNINNYVNPSIIKVVGTKMEKRSGDMLFN